MVVPYLCSLALIGEGGVLVLVANERTARAATSRLASAEG